MCAHGGTATLGYEERALVWTGEALADGLLVTAFLWIGLDSVRGAGGRHRRLWEGLVWWEGGRAAVCARTYRRDWNGH